MKIYKNEYCDLTQNRLFDLERQCRNTQRYDVQRYPFLEKINDTMLGFFWRPEEISMTKDKMDYDAGSDEFERFIVTEQLKKLIMLDSLQGRAIMLTFGQLTTNPEFEGAIITWDFFENIHSRSYSYNIENMYPDPKIVYDSAFDNEILRRHTETIIRDYESLYPTVLDYNSGKIKTKAEIHEMKRKILRALISVNILEGIRFYSGFSAIWALKEFRDIFSGTSNILKFIARDENTHLSLTQFVINQLRKNEDEGFLEIFKEEESKIYDMYFEASEEEFKWIDYLYSKGFPLGISPELAKSYIKYLTNLRLKAIGLRIIYPGFAKNPLNWVNKYLKMSTSEKALQEDENTDYIIGGIEMKDIAQIDLDKIYKNL